MTGADSAIGRAAAIAFARDVADVVINYLPEEQEDAEEVTKYIREAGRETVLLPGDISHEGVCQRLVADTAEQLGELNILVNSAGKMGKTKRDSGNRHPPLRHPDENQRVRSVPGYKGCPSAPEAGCLHH